MPRRVLSALLLLAPAPAWAGTEAPNAPLESPCIAAAAQAEAERNLPQGVLAAIGRIESGRWNPATRRVEAWPYTINAAGAGHYFATAAEAIGGVAREQAQGTRSIDVGCFQISLLHHPNAFATLDEAFDPLANARYAARFLQTLWSNAGSWDTAIAQYHSATPGIGEPYRLQVMASWNSGGASATPLRAIPFTPTLSNAPIYTRTALTSRQSDIPRPPPGGDPHVIFVHATGATLRIERGPLATDPHVIHIGAALPHRST